MWSLWGPSRVTVEDSHLTCWVPTAAGWVFVVPRPHGRLSVNNYLLDTLRTVTALGRSWQGGGEDGGGAVVTQDPVSAGLPGQPTASMTLISEVLEMQFL